MRRRSLTASTTSGQSLRTSAIVRPLAPTGEPTDSEVVAAGILSPEGWAGRGRSSEPRGCSGVRSRACCGSWADARPAASSRGPTDVRCGRLGSADDAASEAACGPAAGCPYASCPCTGRWSTVDAERPGPGVVAEVAGVPPSGPRVEGRCAGPGVVGAEATSPEGAPPSMLTRRSSRSSRASTPEVVSSAAGSRTRAQISSSSRRGAVAPRISVSPTATRSAARESSAPPKRLAWATRRSAASSPTSTRPLAEASGTALMTTRSRRRRSRSSVKRRGSCPDSTTRSTAPNTVLPSPAANASTTSSSRESGVYPSRDVVSCSVTP